MKTIVIVAGTLLFFSSSVKSQSEAVYASNDRESRHEKHEARFSARELRRNNKEASYQTKEQFREDFGDPADLSWRVTENFEEASFTRNGVILTAYYDIESRLVGTTCLKNFADIPAVAREYINHHYKDYSVEAVLLFDDNEYNDTDMKLYNIEFEDADNYFVTLKNSKEMIILKVDEAGSVSYFKKL